MKFLEAFALVDKYGHGDNVEGMAWRHQKAVLLVAAFDGRVVCRFENATAHLSDDDLNADDWEVTDSLRDAARAEELPELECLDFRTAMMAIEADTGKKAWRKDAPVFIALTHKYGAPKAWYRSSGGYMGPFIPSNEDKAVTDWLVTNGPVPTTDDVPMHSNRTTGLTYDQAMDAAERGKRVTRGVLGRQIWWSNAEKMLTVIATQKEYTPTATDMRATDWRICE